MMVLQVGFRSYHGKWLCAEENGEETCWARFACLCTLVVLQATLLQIVTVAAAGRRWSSSHSEVDDVAYKTLPG
jgi:hypothetical protein